MSRVISTEPRENFRIAIRLEDGIEGIVNFFSRIKRPYVNAAPRSHSSSAESLSTGIGAGVAEWLRRMCLRAETALPGASALAR